ncbi:MAG: hypothetical protein ACIAQF_08275 [Phycisphaerales bacterium JB065]
MSDAITVNTISAKITVSKDGQSISIAEAGPRGAGVPAGGTTGQVLAKSSGSDFDTGWVDAGSGGGGSSTFLGLTDTPSSYVADLFLVTNPAGDAVEFANASKVITLLGLGTAALANAASFATAAQGVLAGTAVQPDDLATVATTGSYDDLDDLPSLFDGAWSSLTGVPSTFAPSAHTHPATHISDSTAAGRSVLTAVDAAAIRAVLSVYSQSQTDTAISDAISSLIGAAPSALDTLAEIADAIADDEDFAATMNAALANRLRLDASGGYTSPQQAQGRDNLGLGTAATSDADAFAAASHTHAASDITSGTLDDARVSESSVTQHQAALAISGSQVSGKQGPGAAFDGGGAAITDGVVVRSPVTEAGTVSSVYAVADQSGSVDVIVRHYAAADTSFASPTSLGTLSISSAIVGSLGSLSQSVAVGDVLEFEIDGDATSIERLAVRSRV